MKSNFSGRANRNVLISGVSCSTAITDVVTNAGAAGALARFGGAGGTRTSGVDGATLAARGGAISSHAAIQSTWIVPAIASAIGDGQIHGVTANANDGKTNGLSDPRDPAR